VLVPSLRANQSPSAPCMAKDIAHKKVFHNCLRQLNGLRLCGRPLILELLIGLEFTRRLMFSFASARTSLKNELQNLTAYVRWRTDGWAFKLYICTGPVCFAKGFENSEMSYEKMEYFFFIALFRLGAVNPLHVPTAAILRTCALPRAWVGSGCRLLTHRGNRHLVW